ncbi:MAG: ribosome biogenesis GTPase YlqF [Christensenellales bacterium]
MNIQWFPGHMAKTRRLLAESLKVIDVIVEIVDARAPLSTRNPDFEPMFKGKPRILLLNKADLADDGVTARWKEYFEGKGYSSLAVSSVDRRHVKGVIALVENIMREKVESMKARGANKTVRAMVVGIPNVGKSTFINNLRGRAAAKAADRPGVTRGKQWIVISEYLEFLDTPGMLWPKFEDKNAASKLAYLGSVKDDIMDVEELACMFLGEVVKLAPKAVMERFNIEEPSQDGYELFQQACRGRGWIMSGGRLNTERGAAAVLDEFRGGKLGKLSLEAPPEK